jgi:hypothetical protein
MEDRRDHHQETWAFAVLMAALVVVAASLAWAGEGSISVTSVDVGAHPVVL